jgi:UTP--glucose-1-phosphate uridylyltransferase
MANLKGFKAVITAGGIGTRLLPFSKEIPKEMSPILTKNSNNNILVKPIIQAIFEQLYDFGIRDFFIIVGRGKRAIEDHFTPDFGFLELLKSKGKSVSMLIEFYERLKHSNLVFINQPEPLGFGDAVLRAKPYIDREFLVHAGDTYIISDENEYLKRVWNAYMNYDADVAILLQEVKDPREYGVVKGEEIESGVIRVEGAIEKPEKPISNIAIMPVYMFNEQIFEALLNIKPGKGGEIQLTDAIQLLISKKRKVIGVKLKNEDIRLDIGTPNTLIEALRLSSEYMAIK